MSYWCVSFYWNEFIQDVCRVHFVYLAMDLSESGVSSLLRLVLNYVGKRLKWADLLVCSLLLLF